MARPGPDPNDPLAFGAGLALGAAAGVVKGKILANAAGRRRTTSHHRSSQGFRIPPAKVALAAGVGLGLVKAGILSGALNGK